MKIGLVDMDNMGKKRVSFPNLPLMKLLGGMDWAALLAAEDEGGESGGKEF